MFKPASEQFTARQWFELKAEPVTESGCWLWIGQANGSGYGIMPQSLGGGSAHRYALELRLGRSIADGMMALHKCDTPSCVNPEHLYEGTPMQNMADRSNRGRIRIYPERLRRGEANHAKLTEADVRAIRESADSTRSIGSKFGISSMTVSKIRRRLKWTHVA